MKHHSRQFLAISIVAAILLVIQFANPSPAGIWLRTAYDSLYVPLFGIIAICLFLMAREDWGIKKKLGVVAFMVITLSVLSEAAQIPTNRDSSFNDIITNLSGAAGFLCVAFIFFSGTTYSKVRTLVLAGLGMVLISWPLFPLAKVSAAYVERARILPSLVRFDSYFSDIFFRLQCAQLTERHNELSGSTSAELVLQDCGWTGIAFQGFWPDWGAYSTLIIEVENPETDELNVNVRVNDRAHNHGTHDFDDRFNKRFKLATGTHQLRVAIKDIEVAPKTRSMQINEIDTLIIFASKKESGRHLILHSVRLE